MKIFYYPLGLRSKVWHKEFGYIPTKRYSKDKYKLKPDSELKKKFIEMYGKLKCYTAKCSRKRHKENARPNIIKYLEKIIPDSYFGSKINKKKVFFMIKRILTQTHGEFIHLCALYKGYAYDDIPWLDRSSPLAIKEESLYWANLLLLQTVVKPLIRYYYKYVQTFRNRALLVVPTGRLRSFIDLNIQKNLRNGCIKKIKIISPKMVPVNGILRFIPKNTLESLDCRPLVLMAKYYKYPLEKLKQNLKLLSKTYQIGTENCLYEKWRLYAAFNKNRSKLFAVKLDLINAFGSVNLEVLKTIIEEDNKFLTTPQKNFLYKFMAEQYVLINSRKQYYYHWHHGLLQGTKLSPALCELYLSYMVFTHLRQFHQPNTLLHRTVDDILFISTCDSEIYDFELQAMRVFVLNNDKNKMFIHVGEDPHLTFCGKVFNMATREISNSFDLKKNAQVRIKFKFWNAKRQYAPNQPYTFLVNVMKFSYINYCFTRFELNTTCNSVDRVLKNVFDGMCNVAFKLDCAVESIGYIFTNVNTRCKIASQVIKFILYTYCRNIKTIIEKFKGEKYKDIFSYQVLKFICRRAFIVVLKKRSLKYSYLIENLKSATRSRVGNINNVKYFFKLPEQFKNITMQRRQMCL